MAEPSRAEIDEFVRANDVDDRAAADLKDCPAEVQRRVLARGDLSSARNPSAALLVRIRDARVEARGGSGGGSGGWMTGGGMGLPSSGDVEDFIKSNNVDSSAAEALRSASPTVKRVVITGGNISGADNPSAALLARIRDARAGGGGSSGGAIVHSGMGMPSSSDVEDFIKTNDVDVRAAADLRDCPLPVQRVVLSRGDLRSARNPSSALLARIRDAKLGVPANGSMPGMGPSSDACNGGAQPPNLYAGWESGGPPGGPGMYGGMYPPPGYASPGGAPPGGYGGGYGGSYGMYPPPGYAMYPGSGYGYPGYPVYGMPGSYPPTAGGGYPGSGGAGGSPTGGYPTNQAQGGSSKPHGRSRSSSSYSYSSSDSSPSRKSTRSRSRGGRRRCDSRRVRTRRR